MISQDINFIDNSFPLTLKSTSVSNDNDDNEDDDHEGEVDVPIFGSKEYKKEEEDDEDEDADCVTSLLARLPGWSIYHLVNPTTSRNLKLMLK